MTAVEIPLDCVMKISTHTLTWSVTDYPNEFLTGYIDFNSHAHVERDCDKYLTVKRDVNFNSHAHVERDLAELAGVEYEEISTHTLTWSVTSEMFSTPLNFWISTHTLTWSVTFPTVADFAGRGFQLTRSRGA